ncbi:CDP-glycerol glycerophosphotransferase family protein [Desulfobacula sp.]|uniref:CDP-glycerol glycerophosphotransferase family protein n=1 Tax=Desulfobacula sp. TaxID=2593537 RepID=UPI0025B9F6C1|nr:CDP-glycerol glycerophosphotransferase family protein [Desulfobacula sp.]
MKESGHTVAWFVPDGDEAERFLLPEDRRLLTVPEVKKYSPHAVLTSGNMIPDFFPGIKVQLFHGIDSGKDGEADIRGFYDLYCTQSPIKTAPFIKLRQKYKTFDYVETGWSKLDSLFSPHPETQKYKKKERLILYAPTFSKSMTSTEVLYEQIKRIVRAQPWQWIVKFHPKVTSKEITMYRELESSNFQIIEIDDPVPLLQAADVMLSDTSSIVTEFSLLKKPVVTFRNRKPRDWMVHFSDPQDLEVHLQQAFNPSTKIMDQIKKYSEAIHPYRDGRSSHRVVTAIENMIVSGTDHLEPKPLNLIRKFKMRKKLRYFSLK